MRSRPSPAASTLATLVLWMVVVDLTGAMQAVPIEDVSAPPGATLEGRSGYEGEDGSGWTHWITTTQSLSAVVQHYTAGLQNLGWRRASENMTSAFAASRFSVGPEINPQVGLLVTLPLPSGQVAVSVRHLSGARPTPIARGRQGGGGANIRAPGADQMSAALSQLMNAAPRDHDAAHVPMTELPALFPQELLPPRFTVRQIAGGPNRTTVVGIASNSDAGDITTHIAGMKQAGWTEYPLAGGLYLSRAAVTLCKGRMTAALGFEDRQNRVLLTMVSVGADSVATCTRAARFAPPFVAPYLSVPASWVPEPWPQTFGGGGNAHHRRSAGRLDEPSAAVVFAHVAPQIIAGGFTQGAVIDHPVARVARFTSLPGAPSAVAFFSAVAVPGLRQVDAWLEVFSGAGR